MAVTVCRRAFGAEARASAKALWHTWAGCVPGTAGRWCGWQGVGRARQCGGESDRWLETLWAVEGSEARAPEEFLAEEG